MRFTNFRLHIGDFNKFHGPNYHLPLFSSLINLKLALGLEAARPSARATIGYPVYKDISLIFYATFVLLRLFQQNYCYNVTGQSHESEGSCKPARIKEVHSKLCMQDTFARATHSA